MFKREKGAGLVDVAGLVWGGTTSPVGKFNWDSFCVFSKQRHCFSWVLVSMACGRACLFVLFPLWFICEEALLPWKTGIRLGSFMVTLPTRAYIGGEISVIEVYGKFSTGFRLQKGMESINSKQSPMQPEYGKHCPHTPRMPTALWCTTPLGYHNPPTARASFGQWHGSGHHWGFEHQTWCLVPPKAPSLSSYPTSQPGTDLTWDNFAPPTRITTGKLL